VRCLSGRKGRFAKPLYGLKPVPRVRIPPSPRNERSPNGLRFFMQDEGNEGDEGPKGRGDKGNEETKETKGTRGQRERGDKGDKGDEGT
jgi:hypothetical protein